MLPAGTTEAGWDSHPRKLAALHGTHQRTCCAAGYFDPTRSSSVNKRFLTPFLVLFSSDTFSRPGGSGDLRHFYYNGNWQVLEERAGSSSTPANQYVYHPYYVDAIALRYNSSGTKHYYLQDANFNVTAVTDNAGAAVERYAYTPYGEVTVLDADFSADADGISDIANEHLYTGRRLDPETGFQLNRNRFYDAPLGRWLNRDPIGYKGGKNLYEYVTSAPTIYLDPSGLYCGIFTLLQKSVRASFGKPFEGGAAFAPGYWLTFNATTCKCNGKIKLVQAIELERAFGVAAHFDIPGPSGTVERLAEKGVLYPGYVDGGGRGLNARSTKGVPARIEDSPWGANRGSEYNMAVCAVCETSCNGKITNETVLGCINFEFHNYPNRENNPLDSTFNTIRPSVPFAYPGKRKAIIDFGRKPGLVWEKAVDAWEKTLEMYEK